MTQHVSQTTFSIPSEPIAQRADARSREISTELNPVLKKRAECEEKYICMMGYGEEATTGVKPAKTRKRAESAFSRFRISPDEWLEAEKFIAWFNQAAARAGVSRRQRMSEAQARRIARLGRRGFSLREMQLVCLYALRGPERWASQAKMRCHISLRCLLKSTSPHGSRIFDDFLDDAASWYADEYGDDALAALESA